MNDTVAAILSVPLVGAGALAQFNLIRLFVNEWRENRRRQRRRRLRAATSGELEAATLRGGASRRALAAASLLGGVIPLTALAQVSQAPPTQAAPNNASPAPQATPELHTEAQAAAEPPVAPSEPAPLVISADRPGFSETTSIVPALHLQLETGYTFTYRDRDDVETQRNNAPEILARFGLLADRLEVRLSTAGYAWSRSNDGSGGGFVSSQGWSDLAVGIKVKATDQDGWLPRLAFDATTTLGAGTDGISSQTAEPALKLLYSYDLGQSFGDSWKGFTFGGNAIVAWPTTDGDRFTQAQGSVYLNFPVVDRLTGFVEYFFLSPNSKGGGNAQYIDFGGALLVTDRVQLDARVGFGLNQESDNVFAGFGISFLF